MASSSTTSSNPFAMSVNPHPPLLRSWNSRESSDVLPPPFIEVAGTSRLYVGVDYVVVGLDPSLERHLRSFTPYLPPLGWNGWIGEWRNSPHPAARQSNTLLVDRSSPVRSILKVHTTTRRLLHTHCSTYVRIQLWMKSRHHTRGGWCECM